MWFPHDVLRELVSRLAEVRPVSADGTRLKNELSNALKQHGQVVEEQSSRLQQQNMDS